MPAPLPDELQLDSATTRMLGDAEHAVGLLVGTTARMVNPYLVASPLLHWEALLSSRIEGTFSTPEQLVLLEAGGAEGTAGGIVSVADPDPAPERVNLTTGGIGRMRAQDRLRGGSSALRG